MMKVAIAVFGTRVSPRFDCAPAFRVVETDDGRILSSEDVSAEKWSVWDRIKNLSDSDVEVLICGGIDGFSAQQISGRGIRIHSWITGEIEDALSCLLRGELESHLMMGPGGRCCGRWQFGRGRGGSRGRGRRRRGLPPGAC